MVRARRLRRLRPHLFGPIPGHDDIGTAVGVENVLSVAVGPRRIVGVDAVHSYPFSLGAYSLGQFLAPAVVIAVAQLSPVQGAQNHRQLIVRH